MRDEQRALDQLLCSCGDPRVIIEDFGPRRIKISCISGVCTEELMMWFDIHIEAIEAWEKKYGHEEQFEITFKNGVRFKTLSQEAL